MAIEEVIFTNTNGEEISLSNIVNQMINYFILKRSVGETKITDFEEGSEIRNMLEAFAIGIYALLEEQNEATKIAFISMSYGIWLDRIGEMPFINMERVTGDYAQGEVTFTLATEQTEDIVIPEDTIVMCSDSGLDFATTSECAIVAGELSDTATVEATLQGVDYNVLAGSIDTIVDDNINTELVSVTNLNALENGADDEDDDTYRDRLLNNIRADGFGSVGWYVNLCTEIEGVHDVLLAVDEDYTRMVLVNGLSKPTPDTVLLDVLTRLTDVSNKNISHSFMVDKPAYTTVDLSISLNVATELSEDDLLDNLTAMVDGDTSVTQMEYDGLNINDALSRDDVVSCMQIFDDVVEVTSVVYDGEELDSVSPDFNGVIKLGTVTFTQTVV